MVGHGTILQEGGWPGGGPGSKQARSCASLNKRGPKRPSAASGLCSWAGASTSIRTVLRGGSCTVIGQLASGGGSQVRVLATGSLTGGGWAIWPYRRAVSRLVRGYISWLSDRPIFVAGFHYPSSTCWFYAETRSCSALKAIDGLNLAADGLFLPRMASFRR